VNVQLDKSRRTSSHSRALPLNSLSGTAGFPALSTSTREGSLLLRVRREALSSSRTCPTTGQFHFSLFSFIDIDQQLIKDLLPRRHYSGTLGVCRLPPLLRLLDPCRLWKLIETPSSLPFQILRSSRSRHLPISSSRPFELPRPVLSDLPSPSRSRSASRRSMLSYVPNPAFFS
jgi:hypothetical protein